MIDSPMQAFLTACGLDGPLVVGIDEPGVNSVSWRVLDRPFAVVGRGPETDLVLNHPALSRRHAYLQMIGGRLFFIDLHSRSGSFWGDERGIWGWVNPDPGIRVGPYRLLPRPGAGAISASSASRDEAVPVSRSYVQPSLADMTVEVVGRSAGSKIWQGSRSLVLIGKSTACKIQIEGEGIANIHASLVRTPTGVFVVDLLSRRGVVVNGSPVRWAQLGAEDELLVGDQLLRIRCATAPCRVTFPLVRLAASASATQARHESSDQSLVAASPVSAVPQVLAERAGTANDLLAAFAQIQQQSSDQSHQTVLTLVQSLATMQQEQMGIIYEELAAIRRLTAEHQGLWARLEQRTNATRQPVALRLVADGATPHPGGAASNLAPASRPAPSARTLAIRDNPAVPPAADSRQAGRQDDEAFHAQVFDRLATIQGERQTRWQRLMEAMLGKGT